MELYIDVIFMVTWGMDAFLLWAAGRLCGFRAKNWRVILGGFLSAVLYCLQLCFFRKNGGFLLSLLLLATGLFAAYYPKNRRNILRLFGASWAVSFLLGGSINVLFTLTQVQRLFGQGIVVQKAYPWWLLPWSIGMAYVVLKSGAKWIEANIQRRREFCTAVVLWRGKGVECRTLIDTGNGLKGKDERGVAVLEFSVLLPLFSTEESVCILSGDMGGLEYLPFTSLGNSGGRLYGISAEKLVLSFGEEQIIHKNIFIGINMEDFTGAYEGLVPPCLLEEE